MTYANTELTHKRALKVLPHLVECATSRKTITYGELAKRLGIHHRTVGFVLGYIRDEICSTRGLPLLNVIVVNKAKQLPGKSFLREGTAHLTHEQYRQEFERNRDEVFAYQAWRTLLTELGLEPLNA